MDPSFVQIGSFLASGGHHTFSPTEKPTNPITPQQHQNFTYGAIWPILVRFGQTRCLFHAIWSEKAESGLKNYLACIIKNLHFGYLSEVRPALGGVEEKWAQFGFFFFFLSFLLG